MNWKRLPEQKRYIPSEIVEEILVNLSVKPLLRFSSVSKAWNSIISDSRFILRHRKRAATAPRIVSHGSLRFSDASTCPISSCIVNATPLIGRKSKRASMMTTNHNDDSTLTPLIFPFKVEGTGHSEVRFLASCGELWCVHYANSIFLWNPSTTTSYKKLPHPSAHHKISHAYIDIGTGLDQLDLDQPCEVYSLRSDSWRRIDDDKPNKITLTPYALPCNGALHWMGVNVSVVSFNLSTEKYGEVARPELLQLASLPKLAVLRGKLCLCESHMGRFDTWEMQEYGVAESWTKTFVMSYDTFDPASDGLLMLLTPLYIYDDGRLLIKACYYHEHYYYMEEMMFIFTDDKTQPRVVRSCRGDTDVGHLYLETLVSPPTYAAIPPTN